MKHALLALILVACATTGTMAPPLTVSVTSHHWGADALRVYCDNGHRVGVLHDVTFSATRTRRLHLADCRRVYLSVDVIGRQRAWTAPDYVLVEPGDSLVVTIGPSLSLTAWRVRQ